MLSISAADEFKNIERVQECAGDDSLWPEVLRSAETALNCSVYLLDFNTSGRHTARYCDFDNARPIVEFLENVSAEAGRSVLSFLLQEASLNYPYCKVKLTTGALDTGPASEVADWPGLITPVFRSEERSVLLACFWTKISIGDIDPEYVMPPFRRFAKAVSASLALTDRLLATEAERQAMKVIVDRQDDALCLLGEELEIHYSTPSFETFFNAGTLFIRRDERLVPIERELDAALRSIAKRSHLARSDHMGDGEDGSSRLETSVFLTGESDGLLHVSIQSLAHTTPKHAEAFGNARILMRVRQPTSMTEKVKPLLQSAFGLSNGEARLAYDLASSGSLSETLENLEITRNTAKTHLRRIYEKTGTQSQVELIQLLHSLSGLF